MKLSIITINRNNASGLRKTIESVVYQTFKDYEYIIIDGASTDESIDIIKNNLSNVNYWVSEPDGGIYDAMNKGIKAANGEYCLFLNSGDYLASNSTLEKVFEYDFFEDIVYGNIIFENSYGQRMQIMHNHSLSILNVPGMGNQLSVYHPSSFIKLNLFSRLGLYRTDLSIASDQAFFVKVIFEYGATYRYIPVAISVFNTMGISSSNIAKCQQEDYKIVLELFKYPTLHNSIKSIAFYDRVWSTPLVKSWYNFYNALSELILKIKRFFGKDFWYNNSKYLKHKQPYIKFLSKKIRVPKNKKLLVWGTGDDGSMIHKYCGEHKIFIYGFLDSNKEKQQYAFFGRPVFAPEFAFENKGQDFFIVIASRNYCEEISAICQKAGLIENKDFVVPFERA